MAFCGMCPMSATSLTVPTKDTMDNDVRLEAARQLAAAYTSREPLAPLVETYPDITLDDSYEIQQIQLREKLDAGAQVVGYKVGLTSAVMQRQMGVDQPDYGYLLDEMTYLENAPVPTDNFVQPKVEPEIAFVLGRDVSGPNATVAQVMGAIEYVVPALEIIDSRVRDWQIGLLDTVADNASSGGVVLGSRPTALVDQDLRLTGCNLYVNGRIVGTGAGGAVLGSPLTAAVWLINTLGARGVTLRAGQVVLSGSVTAAVSVARGDTVSAQIAGLGTVTTRFV